MNVLLVSQCDKRALVETRRILDQFAERRGERTWQTPITQAGLDTLRKLLRKTARRNTAVACHWIRGRDHSELLWIVGDASRFNDQGAVPTNTTRRNVLRAEDENDWHSLEDIRLLAQMAALLHDLGKSAVAFQRRLWGKLAGRNRYRHEWLSLRLFQAFVGTDSDEQWLKRLVECSEDDRCWLERLQCDDHEDSDKPFAGLPPLAAAIGWLIVTHHRLPVMPVNASLDQERPKPLGSKTAFDDPSQLDELLTRMTHDWNEQIKDEETTAIAELYWKIDLPWPVLMPKWRRQVGKLAQRLLTLLDRRKVTDWLGNPYLMHLARLSLMLADHHYSALEEPLARVKGDAECRLYANTDRKGKLKQKLDEHLLGVSRDVGRICHGLPTFSRHLSSLKHKGLRKRSADKRFRWQDKAFDMAAGLRQVSTQQGAFIINMASTGCGKTLANARILYALCEPERGMRATFALGLRTLTQQTGRSYREDLHLGEDQLAVLVGGTANRALFEYYEGLAEKSGSASQQALLEEDSYIDYEGQIDDHALLRLAMADRRIERLLSAPLLVCTVDHLTPATEAQRAGRQIAPMLRLMSSDLVLDELDDFDLADLPALTRLVYWSGMLGSRVLLSSATLPPTLIEGMFKAYNAGRSQYRRNRGEENDARVPCLWVDEFGATTRLCLDSDLAAAHDAFVQGRVAALEKLRSSPVRCGELVPVDISCGQKPELLYHEFAELIQQTMIHAHDHHHERCPVSGKRVSFGLVRMANIEPLFDVALNLLERGAPEGYCIHLCVYHARFPLLMRSAIEHRLDTVLNRRQAEAVYHRPDIRRILDSSEEDNHLFVVLGSPVTEVGRDHDYDWALVEPSSMRSLIQLAGRVERHRQKSCASPNIFIFDSNLRHLRLPPKTDRAVFIRPGFELAGVSATHAFRLSSHRLTKLLREDEYRVINARPRIQMRVKEALTPKCSLVDLEHARMMDLMLPKTAADNVGRRGYVRPVGLNAADCWQYDRAGLTWILPQQQPFRAEHDRDVQLLLLPDDDEERLLWHRVQKQKNDVDLYIPVEQSKITRLDPVLGPRIRFWGQDDLLALLREQSEAQGLDLREAATRFTTVSVPDGGLGWRYHPALGFALSA